MIQKMTKYTIVLLNNELESFLNRLQDFGMVDVTRSTRAIDTASKEMMDEISRYRKAIRKVAAIENEMEKSGKAKEEQQTKVADTELLSYIESVIDEKTDLASRRTLKTRELEASQVWGDFDRNDISRIESLGYRLHYYTCPTRKFDQKWEEQYPIQILNQSAGKIYFTVLSQESEELQFPLQESKFPESSVSELDRQLEELDKAISENDRKYYGLCQYSERLKTLCNKKEEYLEYYFAHAATKVEGEGSIAVMEGFAPECEEKDICGYLDSNSVIYLKEKAKAEDNPPVKLKNNFFARPFETIGNLYMLPRYNEPDLTPYFAPFYMLFFGLCLGDMGYGLIMLLIGGLAMWKLPKFRNYAQLIIWLGLGTVIMPALSGGFFGAKIYDVIPMNQSIQELFFNDMQLFWFGILFGIVHIIFARLVNVIDCFKKKNYDHALSNIGWILVIIVLTLLYASTETGKELIPDIVAQIASGIGVVLILFCSSPSKKFYLRPLKGIVSLYDITGVFGDVLSYIRLFGLGTAGAILGMVVNSVAITMSSIPYVGWVFAILMLIIGHIAVMALSALGAFVHPMRLTFVEFYKNAEFTGGGRAFNPLKRNINN